MSRGTTLTLYKMYKNCKASDSVYNKAKEAYIKRDEKYPPITTGNNNPYGADLPVIMNSTPFVGYDEIRRCEKSTNVEDVKKLSEGYFLRDDRNWCERIMDWNFGSIFDCLAEHYDLNSYIRFKSMVMLSDQDVRELHTACSYLLSGSWGKVEPTPFVNILADGNNGDSYWKYVYRNRVGKVKNIKFEQDGFKINITCPLPKDEDEEYMDYTESNETFEYIYERIKTATSLCLDQNENILDDDPIKYFLVYERWG